MKLGFNNRIDFGGGNQERVMSRELGFLEERERWEIGIGEEKEATD